MPNNCIPVFTLKRQNTNIEKDLENCLKALIEGGDYILGENVNVIERAIAGYCHVNHAIGVSSGSDALYLSLIACGIGEGDEVITSPFTFFATAGSISRAGAKPVFIDIRKDTYNINSALLESKISSKTRAIIPVHLFGCPADMDVIKQVARRHNLIIIEDAAQALGAKIDENFTGSFGDAGCFSFFPTKNLGAFGDGGMVVTNNAEIAEKLMALRSHGAREKYVHEVLGCNSRLDEIQAAILVEKFKHFEGWTKRRREIAGIYTEMLTKTEFEGSMYRLPCEPSGCHHVYHQYTIQARDRSRLQSFLTKRGIGSAVYYSIPLHMQKAFSHLGYRLGDFPVAESVCSEVISLPMFPELSNEEIEYVASSIIEFFR